MGPAVVSNPEKGLAVRGASDSSAVLGVILAGLAVILLPLVGPGTKVGAKLVGLPGPIGVVLLFPPVGVADSIPGVKVGLPIAVAIAAGLVLGLPKINVGPALGAEPTVGIEVLGSWLVSLILINVALLP